MECHSCVNSNSDESCQTVRVAEKDEQTKEGDDEGGELCQHIAPSFFPPHGHNRNAKQTETDRSIERHSPGRISTNRSLRLMEEKLVNACIPREYILQNGEQANQEDHESEESGYHFLFTFSLR